ncbi:Nif11-like leader peptide family natural product precursor [Chroococcus sp. FPU101]|uniref:Nif11-like leader peptide family natural product precursor n=1 Tax=Chroococcus sp. FPU101 TaxID=1974212 RepID=UPI001A8E6270|nr:Nif11-like leader peptide family natural product precursor [Chroococcus sp. FPU101]
MSKESLKEFQKLFLQSPKLQEELKAVKDQEQFLCLAVERGKENGYEFTTQDIKDLLTEEAINDFTGNTPPQEVY